MAISGLELLESLRVDAGHDARPDHVVHGGPPGEVADGPGEALQERAVRVGLGEPLHALAGDVTRIEVGKDEDVGASGHRALAGHLARCHRGHDGRVQLQLTVDEQIRISLAGHPYRLHHSRD